MEVKYDSAIGSHVGMVRSNNQDSGYAGSRLFLVADGMGGHAGGDVASAEVTKSVANIDGHTTGDAEAQASELAASVLAANKKLRHMVADRPELSGMGTTFTGLITVGNELAVAHIGDSRLYRLRDGKLKQITADHTFVQRLVDSGRITEEEAKTHPRRSVLMRVLGDVDASPELDTNVVETKPGDVWLLCSDGLCGYVDDPDTERILTKRASLQGAVDGLIDKALSHGAPDNVTVVLLETQEATADDLATEPIREPNTDTIPTPVQPEIDRRFAGSAANAPSTRDGEVTTARTKIMGRRRGGRKPPQIEESHFEPRVDEYLAELIAETRRRNRRRRILWIVGVLVALAAIAGGLFVAYQWTQTRYFVGADEDTVVIYQGVKQDIGSFSLYHVLEDTEIPLEDLDGLGQRQVERTLGATTLDEAREIVLRLNVETATSEAADGETTPTPTPSAAPSEEEAE